MGLFGSGGFDERNLDPTKIEGTQEVIRNWIKNIDSTINEISASSSQVRYVAGITGDDQKKALENYIEGAVEEIKSVTSELEEFSADLETVHTNYLAQSGKVGEDIGSVSKEETSISSGVVGFGD